MTVLGGIGFTAPWLLLALLALPLLWLILRAVPPAPIRRRFPGVALLLGLTDDESVTDDDKTTTNTTMTSRSTSTHDEPPVQQSNQVESTSTMLIYSY